MCKDEDAKKPGTESIAHQEKVFVNSTLTSIEDGLARKSTLAKF
jgi:hypothetical protein